MVFYWAGRSCIWIGKRVETIQMRETDIQKFRSMSERARRFLETIPSHPFSGKILPTLSLYFNACQFCFAPHWVLGNGLIVFLKKSIFHPLAPQKLHLLRGQAWTPLHIFLSIQQPNWLRSVNSFKPDNIRFQSAYFLQFLRIICVLMMNGLSKMAWFTHHGNKKNI